MLSRTASWSRSGYAMTPGGKSRQSQADSPACICRSRVATRVVCEGPIASQERSTWITTPFEDAHAANQRFHHEFFLHAQWLLLVKQACNLIKRAMPSIGSSRFLGSNRRWLVSASILRWQHHSVWWERTEALPILRSTFAPPISAIFDIKQARLFLRSAISSRSRFAIAATERSVTLQSLAILIAGTPSDSNRTTRL